MYSVMTDVEDNSSAPPLAGLSRAASTLLLSFFLNATIVIGLLVVFARYVLLSGDIVVHFALVDEIMKHGGVRSQPLPNLSIMAVYPPASHWLAAIIGWVGGSGLVGIVIVSILSVYFCYLIILRLVDADIPLNVVLFAALFAALLPTHSLVGWEVVVNYFYPQLVADVVFFASLLWLSRNNSLWRQMIFIPLAGTATMWIQPAVAIHIIGAGTLLFAFGVAEKWRNESRFPAAAVFGLLFVIVTAVLIVTLHPALRVMRSIALHDGYLEFGYSHALFVALVCAVIGIVNLSRRYLGRAEFVDAVLGSAVVASASLVFLQSAALGILGEGSNYAVKKHMFLVVTLGAMNAVRAVSGYSGTPRRRIPVGWRVAPVFAGLATIVVSWGFATPVAPILEALAYANNAAKYELPGFIPGNTITDDKSLSPLVNAMISISAFEHPLRGGLGLVNSPEQATLVMTRRSPELDRKCKDRFGEGAIYVIVNPACLRIYSLDETLDFKPEGSGWRYATTGWNVAEPWGAWSLGNRGGEIVLILPPDSHGPYELVADAIAFVNQLHPKQDIAVEVNGAAAATWTFDLASPGGERTAVIPEQLVSNNSLRIVFKAIDAVSPAETTAKASERSPDSRVLGIGMKTLILRPSPS
jgi:hypothetical protein